MLSFWKSSQQRVALLRRVTAEDKHKNKLEKKAYFGHYSNVSLN